MKVAYTLFVAGSLFLEEGSKEFPNEAAEAEEAGELETGSTVEELIQDEIVDETDAWFYDRSEEATTDSEAGSPKRGLSATKKTMVKASHFDGTAHLRKLMPEEKLAA